ncbi:Tim44/TimA family putative adaptor protein [Hansschlegelia plantiphila]|uniref:Calcium-binding protein n=1 Tax=Hansschlegelia plantiphila TaxID=374655 RepID=A0A9W6MVN0_9HYPH|nr:Tim44/TimA family putative adaptor protein [Hansschlegelia plantiphila]GLK68604.1 calcium-binding protein [Hansschlegelia plantiphila]
MSDGFDIYTIIILVLAVFIFIRLRSVLGTRTGQERRPSDPFIGRPKPKTVSDKVVPLPQRASEPQRPTPVTEAPEPAVDRWAGLVEADSAAARGLDQIVAAERDFDARGFVAGARSAYEMIVNAFASGDRKTLKPLLAREVFDSFSAAIADRESRGETVESSFISIDKADLVGAEVVGRNAQITMRFVSKLISATRDKAGVVIDGSPTEIADLVDVWTFSRELNARDPNWRVISTAAV